ncbi:hypothetical protein QRE65_00435 (plasmid) [Bacillus cereus]|nr:hypothetical protein QRE65_00435 [Bacillus cereus]
MHILTFSIIYIVLTTFIYSVFSKQIVGMYDKNKYGIVLSIFIFKATFVAFIGKST